MAGACDHADCPAGFCDHKRCTPACSACAVPSTQATSRFWRMREHPPQTPCPYCGAGPGEPCVARARNSHKLEEMHPSRVEVAA